MVDAWAEQLALVKEAVDRGGPAKLFFEDVRTAMSKLTPVTSLETVQTQVPPVQRRGCDWTDGGQRRVSDRAVR